MASIMLGAVCAKMGEGGSPPGSLYNLMEQQKSKQIIPESVYKTLWAYPSWVLIGFYERFLRFCRISLFTVG